MIPKSEGNVIVTVEGQPLKVYLDEEIRTEVSKVSSLEIREKSAGIGYQPGTGKFGNTSGARSERRDYVLPNLLSEEVKARLNFIYRFKGENKVSQFLNTATQMQKQLGPLEQIIKDTKNDLDIIDQEIAKLTEKRSNKAASLQSLQTALNYELGKVPLNTDSISKSTAKKAGKGKRQEQLKLVLMTGGSLNKKEVYRQLQDEFGLGVKNVYNLVHQSFKNGVIEEDQNGKLSWIGK